MTLLRDYVGALEKLRPYPHHLHINNLYGNLLLSARGRLFSAEEVRREWVESGPGLPGPVNLYIGAPFCAARCAYCIYFKERSPGPAGLERYASALEAQIRYFDEALRRVRFQDVYFGGGTPSLFSEADLGRICGALSGRILQEKGGERAVEVNPGSFSAGKAAALAGFFDKLSLGVQSLDPRVLRAAGRTGQTERTVGRAVGYGRKAGFRTVSVDLLRGLYGETPSSFLCTLRAVLSFRPDIIKIYPLIPGADYLDRFYGGKLEAFMRLSARAEDSFSRAMDLATKAGYHSPSGPRSKVAIGARFVELMLPGSPRGGYVFRSEDSPQSVFGLGHHANSYLRGGIHYHSTQLRDDPAENQYRGMYVPIKDEMRRYVLSLFSSSKPVKRKVFRGLFGVGLDEIFGRELRALRELRMLREHGDGVELRPVSPRDRLACAMVFLDFRELSESIAGLARRKLGLNASTGGRTR